MSNMFRIKSIRNVNWNNSIVRASIDLEVLPHGLVLRDCLLKEGQFGWFLSAPSKKLKEPFTSETTGKTHEYMDIAFFPKTIRDELNRVCVEAYDPTGNYPVTAQTTQATQTTTEAGATGDHPLAVQTEEMFVATEDGLPQ